MSESWSRPCTTLTVVEGDVVILDVRGDLDSSNADVFRQALGALPGRSGCILDLSGVAFIDSAGIGAVIGAVRRCRELDMGVAIVLVRTHVRELFHTVGIERIASVVDTRAAALKDLSPPPAAHAPGSSTAGRQLRPLAI